MHGAIIEALRQRLFQIAFDRGGLLVASTLALYLWIVPAHFVDGESPHFALLGALGGAAHPSGYPSYVLFLRALSWLPGTPAHAAGLATAILGAAQMGVLHAACRAWGARAAGASVAVAIFAAAPLVLGIYTEAEVFAANGLVVAIVLWLAAAAGPVQGVWRAGLLGLVAGLGLANHLTCALVAPVGVLGVVRAVREGNRAATLAAAALGLAIGLLPYLYLLVAPVHDGTWGGIDGAGAVVDMFLRRDYGGPGGFTGTADALPASANLGALAASRGRTWLWLPAIAGVAMLGYRSVRADAGEPRWGWAMLAASFVLAGPLLVLPFNVTLDTVGRYVVSRFHLLAALLLVIPIAAVFDLAAKRVRAMVATVVATVGFAALAGFALPHLARTHSPAVEQQIRNTLASLPPDAVMIGEDDDLAAGITYVQLAFDERTDVTFVQWPLTALAWYRDRLARHGVVVEAGEPVAAVVGTLLARGRPVFVEPSKSFLDAYPHYPYGILMRLVARDSRAPTVHDVFALNQTIYASWKLDYERPGPDDEWPTVIHQRYARTWQLIARMLAAAHEDRDAATALAMARDLGPRP